MMGFAGCAHKGPDPWEKMNRGIFWFNEKADQYVLEPVATGWNWVLPEIIQKGLRNFFHNLKMPVVLANDILQLKPAAAGWDLTRIVTNSVFGLGGFIDVASIEKLPKNDEGFGQTLGYWGIPKGPYLVLPLLGPSTPRQAVGFAADTAGNIPAWFIPFWVSATATGVNVTNTRAYYLEEVDQNRMDAFDYYIFMRDAYLENLEKKVRDSAGLDEEADADLYYFDDEEELEDE